MIAFSHVRQKGDDLTRELMDTLQKERDVAATENAALTREVNVLRGELVEAYRTGLTRTGRFILGRAVIGLMLLGVLAYTVFYRTTPKTRDPRVQSKVEFNTPLAPIEAAMIPDGQIGPDRLVFPVLHKFGVAPTSIDTTDGRHVKVSYSDDAYAKLSRAEQFVQARAIARFVWGLPKRSPGVDTISVRFAPPRNSAEKGGEPTSFSFSSFQLRATK